VYTYLKKFSSTVFCIVIFSVAYGQGDKLLFYANIFITTQNTSYSEYHQKTTIWGGNPGIGYSFNKNFTAGLQANYDRVKTPVGASTNSNVAISETEAGAFCRYTKYTNGYIFIYAQTDIGYIWGNAIEEGLGNQGVYNGFQGIVYPGIGFEVSNFLNIQINFGGIRYRSINWGNNSLSLQNDNSFLFNFGRQFSLGIITNINSYKKQKDNKEMSQ